MEFKIQPLEKNTLLISGEIDTTNNQQFEEQASSLITLDGSTIIFDCNDLEYVSSAGLRAILSINKQVVAAGGKMVVRNVQPNIREIFDLTGFSKIFNLE